MTEIVGVLPVLVVPFKKDATIDFESIPRLVEHCLSNEIQGLVIFGLASELYKLTDKGKNFIQFAEAVSLIVKNTDEDDLENWIKEYNSLFPEPFHSFHTTSFITS